MAKSPEVRKEALRLRKEERLSLNEIHARLDVSKGTLSNWLRDFPLTDEEKRAKRRASFRRNGTRGGPQPRYKNDTISKFWEMCPSTRTLTNLEKARIAESAIMFRAAVMRLAIYGSSFDGDRADWVLELADGELKKVQVRWAARSGGSPSFSLLKSHGRRGQKRLERHDFDYLIGYDLRSDTAFIYTWQELTKHKRSVSARPDAAEAWHKITAP